MADTRSRFGTADRIGLSLTLIGVALGVWQLIWTPPQDLKLPLGLLAAALLYGGVAVLWSPLLMPFKALWGLRRVRLVLKPTSVPLRRPLPANRHAIVRLLAQFEQRAEAYFRDSASSWMPPGKMRLDDPQRRAPVDEVVTKIQAELRVASIESTKAAVTFQKQITDIVNRGRVVTKQKLPELGVELRTMVKEFQKALDRGDL